MTDRGRIHYSNPPDLEARTANRMDRQAAWEQERARIAQILDAFSRAPISMASLQPILDLAIEMNKEPR